ncbi:putative ribonuclease H-like domain-containing protein [Tanacetum coccineum]
MNVNSAFLYGTIEEEVYVTQPPGFKDPDHLEKGYKVVKVLYGLHQAPKAWYETLASYMLGNGFKRGNIDQTLFIKKQKGDNLLVQVYVDDIILGSTNKELCTGFKKLIKEKFQMSSMGELTFFIGLQSASTPVDLEKPLVKDRDANDVDVHLYRSMIRSLMYLTSSRLDIMFGESPFELVAYTDSDYAGATQDMKSITRGCQFFGNRLIPWQCKKQTVVSTSTTEAEYVAAASCCGQISFRCYMCKNGDVLEKEVSTADPITTAGEVVTTANVALKSARPKTKGVVMQEPSESTTTTIPSKDKGKGIMVEEPLKMKKKDQVLFDEQEAIRLHA